MMGGQRIRSLRWQMIMKKILAVTICAIFAVSAISQEIPLSKLPPRRPVPDSVAFRLLFHQAAEFKKRSDALDASGLHTEAFVRHLQHKFTLTRVQSIALMDDASAYSSEVEPIMQDLRAVKETVTFRQASGNLLSASERDEASNHSKSLSALRDSVTLKHRDSFERDLPPEDFVRMHRVLAAMCNGDTVTAIQTIDGWNRLGTK
jgi:hypothetical protein